jgi:hypothetical protein
MKKILRICSILLLVVAIIGAVTLGPGVDLPGPIGGDIELLVHYI